MIDEYLALLITCYLYSVVILLPLFALYLLADPGKAPLRAVLGLHKSLVALTFCLPPALFAFTLADSWQASAGAAIIEIPPQNERAPASPISNDVSAVASTTAMLSTPLSDPVPELDDLVFYFFGGVIAWFSAAGILLFALRYAADERQLARLERQSTRFSTFGAVSVIRSGKVTVPFSTGWPNRRIFVPERLDDDAAAVIIRHELNHFRCGHHIWSLVEALSAYALWFNPLSHWLRSRGRLLRELECDEMTIRKIDKYRYARVLVESAERIPGPAPARFAGHAWGEAKSLQRRVNFILGEGGSRRRTGFKLCFFFCAVLAAGTYVFIGDVHDELLREELLESINRDYVEILGSRPAVELDSLPESAVRALLIRWDERFYDHDGVRLLRGSTLTQQLARQFLRDRSHSVERKLKEIKLTRVLESNFSKDELLEMYLNSAFFGNRAYGLASAAMTYFGKPYTELTEAESAMLMPFLAAPSAINSIANPELAAENQQRLLERMAESTL